METILSLRIESSLAYPEIKEVGSAGIDLISVDDHTIVAGDKPIIVKTGVYVDDMTPGYFCSIREKSGNGVKGIAVRAGVIDQSYRGEIGVVVQNNAASRPRFVKAVEKSKCVLSDTLAKLLHIVWKNNDITVLKGSKIAQMIIQPYVVPIGAVTINNEQLIPQTDKLRAEDGGLWRENNS